MALADGREAAQRSRLSRPAATFDAAPIPNFQSSRGLPHQFDEDVRTEASAPPRAAAMLIQEPLAVRAYNVGGDEARGHHARHAHRSGSAGPLAGVPSHLAHGQSRYGTEFFTGDGGGQHGPAPAARSERPAHASARDSSARESDGVLMNIRWAPSADAPRSSSAGTHERWRRASAEAGRRRSRRQALAGGAMPALARMRSRRWKHGEAGVGRCQSLRPSRPAMISASTK